MPRTILDKPKKFDKLVALIRGMADVKGKSYTDLGDMLGHRKNFIVDRMKNPEEIKIGELITMCRGLNIPIEDVRQCIRY